jgi:hypothetical protein
MDEDMEIPSPAASSSYLEEPGDHPVDVSVTCVITRFGLRSPLHLLPIYFDYRRVVKEATGATGLLRSAFLIENLRTCYSISIWTSPDAIPFFGTAVPSHVLVARRVFGRVVVKHGRPDVWSTKWRLATVSNNLNWSDFDLRGLIANMSICGKGHV